ncbi:hypothetical protein N1031_06785 [Herbiconiux moechotypicola]|uniref:DUF3263 domain-containing protein n=1 Tax=Herbiconiux moechotypicola TaxID=637393 RepID=A0ABN3DFV6_9MICO|nr:hypothetical protein [Herbiconiux moechotypicola]MCS5729463.1 hypothetical protein [Herbiconiux moechotypicola]
MNTPTPPVDFVVDSSGVATVTGPRAALADRLAEAQGLTSNSFQRRILFALTWTGKHVYAGTVPADEVMRRRRRNKAARASRRLNRKAA